MQLELTIKEFRTLLDLVYIGNWILNNPRKPSERFPDYDRMESRLFALCREHRMDDLAMDWKGRTRASFAYTKGGIHTAIELYESRAAAQILAEEFAEREFSDQPLTKEVLAQIAERMNDYMEKMNESGLANVQWME